MRWKYAAILFPVFLMQVLLLNSCGGNVRAPVVAPAGETAKPKPVPAPAPTAPVPVPVPKQSPAYHIVNKGDTLYSIAWNYGVDYRDVASMNGIKPPYIIYPGQKLLLQGAPGIVPAPDTQVSRTETPVLTPGPIIVKTKPVTGEPEKKETVPGPSSDAASMPPATTDAFTWSWPTQGSIIKTDTPISRNGIDIAGKRGQQITASAPGEVVYSGSGLLGYGRLIIIKHNDTFLSAYAHNSELLVQEGDLVRGGQNIALMGETTNGKALLHFEIRKNGLPVDPLKYLPRVE